MLKPRQSIIVLSLLISTIHMWWMPISLCPRSLFVAVTLSIVEELTRALMKPRNFCWTIKTIQILPPIINYPRRPKSWPIIMSNPPMPDRFNFWPLDGSTITTKMSLIIVDIKDILMRIGCETDLSLGIGKYLGISFRNENEWSFYKKIFSELSSSPLDCELWC